MSPAAVCFQFRAFVAKVVSWMQHQKFGLIVQYNTWPAYSPATKPTWFLSFDPCKTFSWRHNRGWHQTKPGPMSSHHLTCMALPKRLSPPFSPCRWKVQGVPEVMKLVCFCRVTLLVHQLRRTRPQTKENGRKFCIFTCDSASVE